MLEINEQWWLKDVHQDPNFIVHVYFLIVFWLEVIIHNEVYRAVISVLRATFQNVILRNSPIIFAKFASAIKRISESTGYDANAKKMGNEMELDFKVHVNGIRNACYQFILTPNIRYYALRAMKETTFQNL